jgi:integrase
MARLHLTDVVVQRLKDTGIYYDTTTPAFGIRVGKNRKVWIVTRGKARDRISLGRYPEVSLADARKKAKLILISPEAKGDARTFQEAFDEYAATLETRKPRTRAEYLRLMNKHFVPTLGTKRLKEVTYEQVVACTHNLKKSEAAHALVVCRAFFRWCVKPPRRYIPSSPIEGIEIRFGKPRKRILETEEVKAVWGAAREKAYPYGTIVQLLQLTGQRRNEIANLRRPWINEKQRTITLPDTITKNKKEHTFPYGDLVASILDTIPRWNETDLLFPSRTSFQRPFSGWSKSKKGMKDGVPGWRLHDLRRTYRSIHGQIGTPPQIAERLINHAAAVQTEVEEIYDRWSYLPQMRSAVEAFESHFSALLARAA